jgi:transposase
VIVSKEGIPLIELTLPNNHTDAKVAKKLIKKLKRVYRFKKKALFIADAAYDEKALYEFIVNQLKCQAFIPINPRNTQPEKIFGAKGLPLCDANLEMKSNGKFKEANRERLKFRCPLKTDKTVAQKYPQGCPINHPRFFEAKQYGCTKYLDITNDARAKVPRDTLLFKETYKVRTEVERYFSRLGNREVEQTTHYKLRAIKNQMTIAHLSLSLVAYAAAILMKKPDKIRCFRTFAQQPLTFKKAA